MTIRFTAGLLLLTLSAGALRAAPVFTDFTSFTPSSSIGAGNGTATGTLTLPGGVVTVSYSGDVRQGPGVTTDVNGGANVFNYNAFTPVIAPSDVIANDGGVGNTHTLTFSSPLVNPVLHVHSLGNTTFAIDWTFSAPFTMVSQNGNLSALPGNVLRGQEGDGTLLFSGTLTSIRWVSSDVETTAGFEVGADDVGVVAAVPEPGNLLLVGVGGLTLAGLRRRRRAG